MYLNLFWIRDYGLHAETVINLQLNYPECETGPVNTAVMHLCLVREMTEYPEKVSWLFSVSSSFTVTIPYFIQRYVA